MKITLMLLMLGVAALANAADDDIEYRQNVLRALGGHTEAAAAIVQGEVPHREHLEPHARSIEAMSGLFPDMFPEGSDRGATDALPDIWAQPDEFEARIRALQEQASVFNSAVQEGDPAAIGGALMELGQACRDCHDDFRAD